MFNMFGGKGNPFDPSLHIFPDVNVPTLSKRLKLVKRGEEDGEKGIPSSTQTTFTKTELEALSQVEALRKEALNNFDDQLRAYKNRVSGARSDTSNIKLKIFDAVTALGRTEKIEAGHLETALVRVAESQRKLDVFREVHRVVGPPSEKAHLGLTWSLILIMLILESAVNGNFFAQKNELGLVGGVFQAFIISVLNVAVGYLCGTTCRYKNLPEIPMKLMGYTIVVFWLGFTVLFNFAVAHFRDALETLEWGVSLKAAVSQMYTETFNLASLSSWTLLLVGCLVSIVSYLKGYHSADRLPGYNRLWSAVETAIDDYASAYEESHEVLEEQYSEKITNLRIEVESRRADLRSAVDALDSRGSMLDSLRVFLRTTNGALNQLLKEYREANVSKRKEPTPAYFDQDFSFPDGDAPDRKIEDLNVGFVEVEIAKMEKLMNLGVERLTWAQRRSLEAFPTVQDIKAGRTGRRSEVEEVRLELLLSELDALIVSEDTSAGQLESAAPQASSSNSAASSTGALTKVRKSPARRTATKKNEISETQSSEQGAETRTLGQNSSNPVELPSDPKGEI